MAAWYHEHLRSYEVCKSSASLFVTELKDLNDVFPLSVYRAKGKPFVTLKLYFVLMSIYFYSLRTMEQSQLLRVIVNENDIRKLTLQERRT